jgi:hypothetical protein
MKQRLIFKSLFLLIKYVAQIFIGVRQAAPLPGLRAGFRNAPQTYPQLLWIAWAASRLALHARQG